MFFFFNCTAAEGFDMLQNCRHEAELMLSTLVTWQCTAESLSS